MMSYGGTDHIRQYQIWCMEHFLIQGRQGFWSFLHGITFLISVLLQTCLQRHLFLCQSRVLYILHERMKRNVFKFS